MKPKLFLLAAAISSGIAMLHAQDAPKPPQAPGGGDPKARMDEAFKKMDANGDGKVSKEEFLEFSKKEAEARFSKMDAAGSGSVTKEQLMEAMRRMHGGDGGQRRPDGFNKPENTDGGTRPRPGGDNNTPGGNPPPQPVEGGKGGPGTGARGGMGGGMMELFKKIQENGSISKEEFIKISEEQFKRMDANGDGKITKEEMEEMGKKMREMRGGQGGSEGGIRRPPSGDGTAPPSGGDKPKRPPAD
ncbi:MAG: EF-hand domain-containing protein [Verrucomicrobia bacterium]|nr:EF-hand domain-containing protein [Verrucomicrobiota bacterium]